MSEPEFESTLALNRLLGFGWVDGFLQWPVLFRLPTLSAALIPLVILPLYMGTSLQDFMLLLVQVTMTGLTLAVYVILARGAQSDFREGQEFDIRQRLEPPPQMAQLENVLSIVVGFGSICLFNYLFDGSWFDWLVIFNPSAYGEYHTGDLVLLWVISISIFIFGGLLVHMTGFAYRQVQAFCRWAGEVPIDLLRVQQYQVFALQPMRYLLILVIFMSVNLIAYQLVTVASNEFVLLAVQIHLIVPMLIYAWYVVKPVVILKNRIAEAKTREIRLVQQALSGQRSVLADSQIAHVAEEFAAPDLMFYEQQIEAVWEWPVQGNVQRLTLYILLPPLAWVLAALVERVVDSVL